MACEELHALLIPHPLQGHINPLLHFSKKLVSSYGFSITFLLPTHTFQRMGFHKNSAHPRIHIVGFPDGLPDHHPRRSTFLDAYDAAMGLEIAAHKLMQELAQQGRLPLFLIADNFVPWAHDLARKFGLPSAAFVTNSISGMSVMSSASKLVSLGLLPLKTVDGSSKFMGEPINCIPGVPPLLPSELPVSLRTSSLSSYRLQYAIHQYDQARKAAAIIVNSVYEIEKSALDNIEYNVPVYPIGPTVILDGESASAKELEASLCREERDCLLWLDKQAPASVLYVSFGSMASMDFDQLGELALGLEASLQPFLWVIRPESSESWVSDILPPGFLDRTKERTCIISWAPQLLVLRHSAIGGFLTHCGWNSVLENMCLGGLPMICWPDAAEQALNARIIVDMWKIGLAVCKDGEGKVKRGEVERIVRAVMQGEEGMEFRCQADQMRRTVLSSVQEGGSSILCIEKFLEKMKQAQV